MTDSQREGWSFAAIGGIFEDLVFKNISGLKVETVLYIHANIGKLAEVQPYKQMYLLFFY